MGSRGSRRQRRLMTTTMMMTMTTKTTIWRPDLASSRTRGWARGRRASLQVGWHHQCLGLGHQGPNPRSEGRPRGVLDPLAETIVVNPGGQADPSVPQEQVPALAAQGTSPSAVVTTPGQIACSAPWVFEAETVLKPAARQPLAAPAKIGAQGASPQARLALPRSG
jgi:hypothetical protein